jgi:uncharacterized membrane protein
LFGLAVIVMIDVTVPAQRHAHPAFNEILQQRAADFQLRIADKITAFAGSMGFVYLHAALFAVWMLRPIRTRHGLEAAGASAA